MVPTGGSYLYLLPFDIYVTPSLDEAHSVILDGVRITLYAPFLNDAHQNVLIPQVRPDRIPSPRGAVRPDYDHLILNELTLPWPIGERRDAIRIDFSPNQEAEFAESVVARFLGLARWWTRQWWIKRDRSYALYMLRNWFETNTLGERISPFHSFARTYAPYGMEQAPNPEGFQTIVRDLEHRKDIPVHLDLLFDAIHSHSVIDLRRSVLELATSSEIALETELSKRVNSGLIAQKQMDRILEGNDFLKHVERAGRAFRKDFTLAEPIHSAALKCIWIARGQIAHGRVPFVVTASGRLPLTGEQVSQGIRATAEFIRWAEAL